MPKTEKIGSVSAASVKKHTNRDWDQWISELKRTPAPSLSHGELAHFLKTKYKLSTWWQQEVARGFHIAIGKRVANQTLKGTYTTTATKTIAADSHLVYKHLISKEGLATWLEPLSPVTVKAGAQFESGGEIFGEFRTLTKDSKIRLTWNNSDWTKKTSLSINLVNKPKDKCLLVINHTDLPTARAKGEMHLRWRNAADRIAEFFQIGSGRR